MIIAALAMGAVLWGVQATFVQFFYLPGWRYLALLVLIFIGIASYFAIGQLIGAFRLYEFKAALRRGR